MLGTTMITARIMTTLTLVIMMVRSFPMTLTRMFVDGGDGAHGHALECAVIRLV